MLIPFANPACVSTNCFQILKLMGMSDSHISQSVEGGLLLLILFITILTNRRKKVKEDVAAPAAGEAAAN